MSNTISGEIVRFNYGGIDYEVSGAATIIASHIKNEVAVTTFKGTSFKSVPVAGRVKVNLTNVPEMDKDKLRGAKDKDLLLEEANGTLWGGTMTVISEVEVDTDSGLIAMEFVGEVKEI